MLRGCITEKCKMITVTHYSVTQDCMFIKLHTMYFPSTIVTLLSKVKHCDGKDHNAMLILPVNEFTAASSMYPADVNNPTCTLCCTVFFFLLCNTVKYIYTMTLCDAEVT